jgi:hypothetical protein
MKRFAVFLLLLAFSTQLIGCGEEAAPPAGTPGTGPPAPGAVKGEAKKDRDKLFKALEDGTARKTAPSSK